jgi:hypothetical protein
MVPLLEQVVWMRIGSSGLADTAALDTALDALITLNAKVPPELLLAVFDRRPAQATILLARGGDGASSALLEIASRQQGTPWFAAANLLLARWTPGFGAVLLQDIELHATIVVSDTGAGFGGGIGGGAFRSCGAIGHAGDLPPWAHYALTTAPQQGVMVLALGPTPVYYRRTIAPAGHTPAGSESSLGGPVTRDRLSYAAALLRVDPSALPVKAFEHHTLRRSAGNVRAHVERIRANLLERYLLLLEKLVAARALSEDEIDRLPLPAINLVVHEVP